MPNQLPSQSAQAPEEAEFAYSPPTGNRIALRELDELQGTTLDILAHHTIFNDDPANSYSPLAAIRSPTDLEEVATANPDEVFHLLVFLLTSLQVSRKHVQTVGDRVQELRTSLEKSFDEKRSLVQMVERQRKAILRMSAEKEELARASSAIRPKGQQDTLDGQIDSALDAFRGLFKHIARTQGSHTVVSEGEQKPISRTRSTPAGAEGVQQYQHTPRTLENKVSRLGSQ